MSTHPNPSDRQEARNAFRRYLHDRGIKVTTPRQMVLEVVLDMQDHFEAEEVVDLLRQRGSRVGKATVYRALPLLVDCGILKKVRFEAKQAYYERAFKEGPHDHMVCRRCGRIIEFAADEVIELQKKIARQHHFHVTGHLLQLTGLCWECSISCPVARFAVSDQEPGFGPR